MEGFILCEWNLYNFKHKTAVENSSKKAQDLRISEKHDAI